MKPIFTFRQREFARLYAQGMSAAKAAVAAGYAHSTAETNAARLLQNPVIAAYVQQHRQSRQDVSRHQVQTVLQRMLALVADDDAGLAMQAARVFVRLKEAQDRQGLTTADEAALQAIFDKADNLMALAPTQNPDGQGQTQTIVLIPDKIEETDTLPSGHPAFDVRLQPAKPELPKSDEPVIIEFVPVPSLPDDQDEDEQPERESRQAPLPPGVGGRGRGLARRAGVRKQKP